MCFPTQYVALHRNYIRIQTSFIASKAKKRRKRTILLRFFLSKPARGLHRESMMAHDDSTVFLFGPLSPWTYLLHANEGGMADHGINLPTTQLGDNCSLDSILTL